MHKYKDFFVALTVSLAVGVLTLLSCTPAGNSVPDEVSVTSVVESEPETNSGPPPLVVDMSEPLMLDDPTEEQAVATKAAGENMACFVCHANYMSEFLAERHARADVGCVNCHGDSFAHRNDENNTTPPEIMYSAEKIDPFCRGCHDSHDVPPDKIVARWKELDLNKSDPVPIVCTDCHGEHRMKVRTVVWDKKTGKLLRTNRGD
jgi:hypothetical protein